MNHCCTECPYTAQFETALRMHKQLYHDEHKNSNDAIKEKSATVPRSRNDVDPTLVAARDSGIKLPAGRSSSATRLLGKLRARICRSKHHLPAHLEEMANMPIGALSPDMTAISDCTSNPLKADSILSMDSCKEPQVYSCHMCQFDADRITVLDRHLLNDHKIGLENLLKLVMAKTKDGLSEETHIPTPFGIRKPYYKAQNEILHEEGDFIIETVTPQIKILRHTSTNTDLRWHQIPNPKDCEEFTEELQKMMKVPPETADHDFMSKMQVLNEYMCKFVDSSRNLKKLTKEYDSRFNIRDEKISEQPYFDLELGRPDASSEWDRAHSDKPLRHKTPAQNDVKARSDRARFSADSYYF